MNKHHHYILHKPYGYLSQFVNNQTKRKNKKLLGELYEFVPGTMAIGRLDQDSEGLLLLTTDGKVSAQVLSRQVEKEYYVQVDGIISEDAIQQLKTGVEISIYGKKYETLPCAVFRLNEVPDLPTRKRQIRDERHGPTSWISITLTEGKFRQIRKMTAAVGFPTLRLIRIRIGNINLDNLAPGETMELDGLMDFFDTINPDSQTDDQN
ncbi:pseudouridine synthase [Fulvivirga sedimenti]|uniref:Pseudouridine synthase n=1 Tax=Fulvivirga sedimenti TaxID=2879465 RepID=A0A9X1KZI8_9BACT|nr:pseudouridine synthase [Fulvivirga sedimenti]MCA6075070.1 pseudouridine synthase [Fulvivirga sedimenti]MCA6076247.1 pseudouridine synthase [Fulvivirga sedimenti]MCA6077375.1 pseudouridine synthase [Fulvivirga sedimenti]